MGGCSSDPSKGCSSESTSELVVAINECCDQQHEDLQTANTNLVAIKDAIENCCDQLTTRMDAANVLLQAILNK